jgi:Predicted nucleotide-binding protein containing TIR-like domain
MTCGIPLPRLFVGSSAEALEVAYAIQENLDFDAETTVWSQAFFHPSQSALNDLVTALDRFDFAAFVFAPDDVINIRGRIQPAVRDNVIFELGLFFGALGVKKCFLVMPRDTERPHLPTDLLGVNPLSYAERRSDQNLIAALGPACNQLRRAFRSASAGFTLPQDGGPPKFKTWSINDYRAAWNAPSLRSARNNIREVTLDHYSTEFQNVSKDMRRIFAFLESLSAAVLDGAITDADARATFGEALISFWPVAASMLAPPNLRDEYWDPPPRMSELYARWSGSR